MNSTDFNKIAGAALGALLIFLLLNFFSGQIYGTREAGGHHGDEVLAFALAIESEGGGEAEEAPQVDYAALVAEADPAAGEGVFRACSACHKIEDGANAVGPHLWGVVGRDIAAVEGFSYSDALSGAEGDWTLEHLSGFLENPKGWAPGTKMSFAGISDPQDRVNVIAYLNEADGSPVDLAEGLEPLAAADAGAATDAAPAAEASADEPAASLPGQGAQGAPAAADPGDEASTGTAPAAEQAPAAQGATTGAMPGAAETSVSEGDDAGGEVTGVTIVDNTAENAEVPTSPVVETHDAERQGEDVVQSSDPSPTAPAQENPGALGAPGEGAQPLEGAPDAGDAEEDAATAGTAPPEQRVEGEDAPPMAEPGQAPEREAGDDAGGEQLAAAPEAEPAEPAAAAAAAGGAFAGGDAAAGEKIFRRCAACHKVEEGKHGIGPSLWGVVGRDVAAVEGYAYSDAMAAHEGTWTAENLSAYLENPKAVVPGTKMVFAGLKDEQDRIDVITYLNEADGTPEPLQ